MHTLLHHFLNSFLGALVILAFGLTALVQPVCAQDDPPQPPDDVQQIFRLTQEGKYLAALATAESVASGNQVLGQEIATLRSFVGDAPGALAAMDASGAMEPEPAAEAGRFENTRPHSAVDRILELARSRRIVIVNEAHHVALHRTFTHQLLAGLREQGYQYFAAETFNPFTRKLAERGYPTRDTGYYSHEPFFGDLIRESLRLGFKPVAYETLRVNAPGDVTDRINAREADQCANLMERIFDKDPEAKVLIHVGYSHATEDTHSLADGRECAWMAARLAKATGLDPLTIDQSAQTERGSVDSMPAALRLALERDLLTGPTVFELENERFLVAGGFAGKIDVQVFHPPAKLFEGRPDWVTMDGYRSLVPIPDGIEASEGRLLVQAFVASESDDAIPMDQFLLLPGQTRSALALPPGEYRIVVQDEKGEAVGEPRKLSVNVPPG
jgi:hypothetical protein